MTLNVSFHGFANDGGSCHKILQHMKVDFIVKVNQQELITSGLSS